MNFGTCMVFDRVSLFCSICLFIIVCVVTAMDGRTCGYPPVRLAYQPPANSIFSQNKPTTNNQPAVLFSQTKSAPAISHQPNEQAVRLSAFGV
jgi:hypothetical protein